MSYLKAKYNEHVKLRTVHFYLCDCAQLICNNVANSIGGNLVQTSITDLLMPQKTADAEEIKDRIFGGLRQIGEDNERI